MVNSIQQVMTKDPIVLRSDASVAQAAMAMKDHRIGAVVVMENGRPCGIITDRDITVRAVAAGKDPSRTPIADVCSRAIASVAPAQSIDDAIKVMKSRDVKRVLVMSGDQLAGIVSLGDLAARGEASDVQLDLSRAEPNN